VLLLYPRLVEASNVQVAKESRRVVVVTLDDEPITPVTARYIERGIAEAREMGARALVLQLDTPGGLMQATQTIVRDILASPVPVIVYVSPSGARAASAGLFITLAGHVAAMAPATHIGAAHPVSLGGAAPMSPAPDTTAGEQEQSSGVMEEKVVKDAAAWVRSLAELRARNAEWAVSAVTESESITSTEALDLNVIDLTAADTGELLSRVDGWTVSLGADSLRLETASASIHRIDMWWGERVLGVLSNPNVAFILMMVGFYGILFELYTAGWGVGGTVGMVSLLLAFFGLAVLPVNYAGLALIGLGLSLFVAEVFVPSFGLLTFGGVTCLILGGLMLVDTSVEFMQISAWVVVPVALATGAIAVFLVPYIYLTLPTIPYVYILLVVLPFQNLYLPLSLPSILL
jgi:membrane-bound serine protease (ClpP class)